MTGRYAHNHRVLENNHAHRLNYSTTLQRYLREAGYTTSIAGKLLNGWNATKTPPHMDRWAVLDTRRSLRRPRYINSIFNVDGRIVRANRHSTVFIAHQASRFLRSFERDDEVPWLMYVTPFSPHSPSTPTVNNSRVSFPPYAGNPAVFESDRSDKPPWIQKEHVGLEHAARVALLQRRSLLDADDLVGDIFKTLDRLSETRDTLAFFMSDNGYMWGEHEQMEKFLPYQPSVRIPLLVRWPGQLPKGRVDGQLAANIDVTPTALDAAGVPIPSSPGPDGKSLFDAPRKRLLLEAWSLQRIPEWASLVTKRYQYIESYTRKGRTRFKEYYRLRRDPWQLSNAFRDGRRPSRVRRHFLTRTLALARACRGRAPRGSHAGRALSTLGETCDRF